MDKDCSKSDARKRLTRLVSVLDNVADMAGLVELHEALEKQYAGDTQRISNLNDELAKLRPAFVKYRELSEEHAKLSERWHVLLGIIGYLFSKEQISDLDMVPGIPVESHETERKRTPLWKVLREFARQEIEVRIVDLEAGLAQYGYTFSRQAIESAIDTHKDIFRSTRKGRERFVSLK